MDILENISSMSIAELKKVLSDNNVNEFHISSKGELIQLVSDTILSKMMIDQLQDEVEQEYKESKQVSKCLEVSKQLQESKDASALRLQQDNEYNEAVVTDLLNPDDNGTIENDEIESDVELSPTSLRRKRLAYLEQ